MTIAIRIDDLSFSHQQSGRPVFEQVSISVTKGETVALLGSSGAGKTTLLTLLDGRHRDWQGSVSVLGSELDPGRAPPLAKRTETGFIFQEFALVERSTVQRNVINGRLGRMGALRAFFSCFSAKDVAVTRAALSDCRIADIATRRVDSLSGGQRQRVAIARCLAQEPQLILADEPVSNLDPTRSAEILKLLTHVARQRGATTVFSSHQPELARRFADRIIGLRNGRMAFDVATADLTDADTMRLYVDAKPAPSTRLRVV